MSNNPIINLDTMTSNIKRKHQEFMTQFGRESDFILQDRALKIETTFTRLNYVLKAFCSAHVIDEIAYDKNVNHSKMYLHKGGFDNEVCIATNGDVIVVDGTTPLTSVGYMEVEKIKFKDVSHNDFDWERFAEQLLSYIHSVIYERQQACEMKVWGKVNNG